MGLSVTHKHVCINGSRPMYETSSVSVVHSEASHCSCCWGGFCTWKPFLFCAVVYGLAMFVWLIANGEHLQLTTHRLMRGERIMWWNPKKLHCSKQWRILHVQTGWDGIIRHHRPSHVQQPSRHTCTLYLPTTAVWKSSKFLVLMYNLKILLLFSRQPAVSLTLSHLFWVPFSAWINGHCLTMCLCAVLVLWQWAHLFGSSLTLH